MQLHRWNKMSEEDRERLLRRSEIDISELLEKIRPVVEEVRKNGDKAVSKFTSDFDRVELSPASFKVRPSEFDKAQKNVSKSVKSAIEKAVANVKAFHEKQMPPDFWMMPIDQGVFAGEKISPISSCALYVPRGKGSFPSVMIMLGVPAVVARVPKIVVVSPPNSKGEADAATLFAAQACGITDVYKIGGPHTVAALAYGTKKIPKVDKIIGPGSGYVTAAKRILSGVVDVGLPAGPSESIILADDSTDPEIAAMDLLIEQEHGPDSTALLVTNSEKLIRTVGEIVPGLIKNLPEPRRSFVKKGFEGFGGAVLTASLKESIDFVNAFAPEHLEILVSDPFSILNDIKNAGEILMGPNTPITLGNFCLGVNAILPTGGFAKTFSGVTVNDFLKRSSVGYVTEEGFMSVALTAETLARYEGFPAHAAAVSKRLRNKKQKKVKN